MPKRKPAVEDPFRVHALMESLEEVGGTLRDANQGPDVPVGLHLPDDLTVEEGEKLLSVILFLEGEMQAFFRFATGDVFRAMQKTGGTKRYRIEQRFGAGVYHSLRNRAYVAGQFASESLRVPGVDWEVYRAITGLDQRAKQYWLTEAKRGLSAEEIRKMRRGLKQ